jgi:sec-independent protein translocase protein TatB
MFDISWGKLVIIGVVALLVIGPKELPAVLRQLGQAMAKIRRMAAEFQGQFQEAMREAEMADLKKSFDETTAGLQSTFDTTDIKNELEKMIQDPVGTTPGAENVAAAPPSDPTATAPEIPPSAPTVDISVPMPELPPPPETKDFLEAAPAAPAVSPPAASAAPEPKPVAAPEGGKAA